MNFPIWIYPVLLMLGALMGAVINWFVDRYCWTPRFRSPWRFWPTKLFEQVEQLSDRPFSKSAFDFIPILGWFALRRLEAPLRAIPESDRPHGMESPRFWVRPCLIEFACSLGTLLLFFWEVHWQMLLPAGLELEPTGTVLVRYFVHLFFFSLLLTASLIDIDDMIIPDQLTILGTVLGLILIACLPQAQLPSTEVRTEVVLAPGQPDRNPMENYQLKFSVAPQAVPHGAASPLPMKTLWNHDQNHLALMSLCWTFWCFAMLRRIWYFKLPFKKAAGIFLRYLTRAPSTYVLGAAAILFPILLYKFLPGSKYEYSAFHASFLSALLGMAVGMIMIWATRLIGSFALGREAMGFGDVTLMGMIGVYVGWQNCILIFFMAPFAGLIFGIIHVASGRGREFPYGPYLCLASALLVLAWNPLWTLVAPYFELGWIIGAVMAACLLMLGVLLSIWAQIKKRIGT